MRLLFDEHSSHRLPALVAAYFPQSLHLESLGLMGAADDAVWQSAADFGCVLVTKDEDFHRLSVLRGAPPKVIWLRIGNCTTADVASLLCQHQQALERFAEHPELNVLELGG